MTTHVLRARRTLNFNALRLVYIALGLVALALVLAALASSDGSASSPGTLVSSGRAVAIVQPDEGIPPGSGVAFGREFPK